MGIKVAYTPLGIVIALVFIGLPFVVRTVQPIMEEIDKEVEEAAATLGANRFQTITRVLFPGLAPAIVTGFALAFARGVGEYGSVIFIAGNLPYVSEIAPLLIVIRLEEYDYAAATAIAAVMLGLSFVMLLDDQPGADMEPQALWLARSSSPTSRHTTSRVGRGHRTPAGEVRADGAGLRLPGAVPGAAADPGLRQGARGRLRRRSARRSPIPTRCRRSG